MADLDLTYQQALQNVEHSIMIAMENAEVPPSFSFDSVVRSEATLDAWDYCYAIAIGLAGVFIATNDAFAKYLEQIHKAASGASGEYDVFQAFLGKALHHEGDYIDAMAMPFKNRNGGNAYPIFHRLLWGHDILSTNVDNPFVLMFNQKGLSGILQAVQHLLADTASKQGLPLPGSSFLDIADENNKTSNYLIKVAQQLSEESIGLKSNAQEIYAHMMTIRAQDISAGVVVKLMSELYFKLRRIEDEIRCAEIRLIAYTVNFVGEAVVGSMRQNGVPYINIPLASAMAASFARFCYLNSKEIRQLSKATATVHVQVDCLEARQTLLANLCPTKQTAAAIIEADRKTDSNIDELLDFFRGEEI
ncbi:hypothetical protein JQM68_13405 [Oscillibacter valericigenes]|uniref:hypothetical protein n=1 Tax=Oscillibacter valericigenes TaxID=351091 RepID=UPI001F1CC17F|nr:hypothetical protein [Oscillibacter valericigenes]MCF2618170.1 hypothetical protein [Oscillibacter valericigenes]